MPVVADIAAAVVTAIQALDLVDDTLVVRRKTPTLPPDKEPPAIVVSVGEEGASESLTGVLDAVRYPVQVTIITGDGTKAVDNDTLRTWRESIRVAVNKGTAFASVANFESVDPEGRAPFHPAALPKDLNYSILVFTVEVTEARAR